MKQPLFYNICKDSQMGEILDQAVESYIKKVEDFNGREYNQFCRKFINSTIDDIQWNNICNYGLATHSFKFAIHFIIFLLNKKLYHGLYLNELSSQLKLVESDFYNKKYECPLKTLLCRDNIRYIYIIKWDTKGKTPFNIAFLKFKNKHILHDIVDFIKTDIKYWHFRDDGQFLEMFENSLLQYSKTIKDYKDYNSSTFFCQIKYFKKQEQTTDYFKKHHVSMVVAFYRYLINRYPEYNIFYNSENMSKALLFSNSLVQMLMRNYYFTQYNPLQFPGVYDKYCFLLKNQDRLSTRIKKEDWANVDISDVCNSQYKELIIKYYLHMVTPNATYLIGSIIENTAFILNLKEQENYPNKNPFYLTTQEAILIRNYILSKPILLSTKNNKIGAVRRFIEYTNNLGLIDIEGNFLNYLKQIEEPSKGNPAAISDEDLVVINNALVNSLSTNWINRIVYVVFHLALQTEFRISQICNLKIDCIKPSVKPNQYIISTNSKTSHGASDSFVITEYTHKLLMDLIEDTEEMRKVCNIEAYQTNIFLYHKMYGSIGVLTPKLFNDTIKQICKEKLKEAVYTAANLRDTHMTKAFEYVLRNNKSNAEMKVLSNHRHIDTTKNHYIDMQLEKMLESTYGVIIGEDYINTESKIQSSIPEEFHSKIYDVNDGCGKCTAKQCISNSALPCMVCNYFITTPAYEVFFKKAIESIDVLIGNSFIKHDKEDLLCTKKLYVAYLKSIYKYMEEHSND